MGKSRSEGHQRIKEVGMHSSVRYRFDYQLWIALSSWAYSMQDTKEIMARVKHCVFLVILILTLGLPIQHSHTTIRTNCRLKTRVYYLHIKRKELAVETRPLWRFIINHWLVQTFSSWVVYSSKVTKKFLFPNLQMYILVEKRQDFRSPAIQFFHKRLSYV